MNQRAEWLNSLTAGDRVARKHGYGTGSNTLLVVERVTNTQIVTSAGKYRRHDGLAVGQSYSYAMDSIVPVTPELLQAIRRETLCSRLQHGVKWDTLPLETLEAVAALLP